MTMHLSALFWFVPLGLSFFFFSQVYRDFIEADWNGPRIMLYVFAFMIGGNYVCFVSELLGQPVFGSK